MAAPPETSPKSPCNPGETGESRSEGKAMLISIVVILVIGLAIMYARRVRRSAEREQMAARLESVL